MRTQSPGFRLLLHLLAGVLVLLLSAPPAFADSHGDEEQTTTQSGRGQDTREPLEATYEPGPEQGPYSGRYFFAMSRGLANSTLHPAFAAPLFLVTIPLDIVLLPAAAIAGFF